MAELSGHYSLTCTTCCFCGPLFLIFLEQSNQTIKQEPLRILLRKNANNNMMCIFQTKHSIIMFHFLINSVKIKFL